jgi:hypothetical protein
VYNARIGVAKRPVRCSLEDNMHHLIRRCPLAARGHYRRIHRDPTFAAFARNTNIEAAKQDVVETITVQGRRPVSLARGPGFEGTQEWVGKETVTRSYIDSYGAREGTNRLALFNYSAFAADPLR